MNYKLLTPGPLTTSDTVKQAMLRDWCTWDDEYKTFVETVRANILAANDLDSTDYTVVLMQGSGSFGVESVITTALGDNDKLLVLANGSYGDRMATIAERAGKKCKLLRFDETSPVDAEAVDRYLSEATDITHVAFVHCETTTGILNPLNELSAVIKKHQKTLIVDAMSSLFGIPIDIRGNDIDFIISSANKCIQGVPGFSFTIAKRSALEPCAGNAVSLSLDLHDQWQAMESDPGKWRFTSPTHVLHAFGVALDELIAEGGIAARYQRYCENQRVLVERMEALGYRCCVAKEHQSPIITTFLFPENDAFSFEALYAYLKRHGFVIYPGKLTNLAVFRIGNIGEIYAEDMILLTQVIANYNQEILDA